MPEGRLEFRVEENLFIERAVIRVPGVVGNRRTDNPDGPDAGFAGRLDVAV